MGLARIPIQDYNVSPKSVKLYEEYQKLHNSKSRQNPTQKINEIIFLGSLHDLVDIGHQNTIEMMKNNNDRELHHLQR